MNNRAIILFTSAFPFGIGEQFIETELEFLAKNFRSVFIFPYNYGENRELRNNIPENVTFFAPFRDEHLSFIKLLRKGLFNSCPLLPYFSDIIKQPEILTDFRKFSLWFRSLLNCRMIMNDRRLMKCISQNCNNLIFYFYWGHRPSGISVLLRKMNEPIIVRYHGTDLFKERKLNRNYIPFQELVLKHIDRAVFISEHGASYIKKKYPGIKTQLFVNRLGTADHGIYPWYPAEYLRIISCSTIDANKRVGLIAKSISAAKFPIQWTHIGDGPLMNELKSELDKNQSGKVEFKLSGRLANYEVHQIYQQQQFDLFINVSEEEGIPFSIMEALSYAIPVVATAVGGVPEIIDASCGILLPVNFSLDDLTNILCSYNALQVEAKLELRRNARNKWETCCNAEKNFNEFVSFLKEL